MAPEGVIVDGWNWVIAGYTVTVVVLVGYALTLTTRLDKDKDL